MATRSPNDFRVNTTAVRIRPQKGKQKKKKLDVAEDAATDKRNNRKLTLDQKVFIVRGFAQYLTAQQIVDRLKEEYEIDVERTHVSQYHPNWMVRLPSHTRSVTTGTRVTGKTFGECKVERGTRPDIGLTWQDVFDAERKQVDDNPFYVPVSRRTVRLAYVDRKVRALDRLGDDKILDYLQHAAKEMGGYGSGNSPHVTVQQTAIQSQGNTVLQSEDYSRAMAELAEKLSRRPDVMLALLPGDVQEKVIEIARGVGVGVENGQAVISEKDK